MVEWRPLIISIFFALAIYAVFYLSSLNGGFIGILFGALAVGYMIDGNMKDGVIHGAILGLITGLVIVAILIFQVASLGLASAISGAILYSLIILLVMEIVIGIIGGVFGILMNSESLESVES
jgi:hypothetical protein